MFIVRIFRGSYLLGRINRYSCLLKMATSSRRKKSEKAVQPRKEDAFLQRYNVELLKCIDDMKLKRDEVHRDILTLSEEQHKLEYDVTHLTGQLARVNESLCKKMKQQTESVMNCSGSTRKLSTNSCTASRRF